MKLLKIFLLVSLTFVFSCSGTKEGKQTTDDEIIEVIFLQVNDVHGNVRDLIMDSASINEDNTAFVKISGEGTYHPNVAVQVTAIT